MCLKTMLTKTKRYILFWFSVIFFMALLVPVFLFSFGYGIGPGLKIQRTGGIAITASVSNANVTAGTFRKKKTSILTKNALIKNLVPGEYKIKVSKEGFWEWEKSLIVNSEKVTQRETLLIPLEAKGEILGTTTPNVKKPELPPSVKKFWELKKSGEYLILGEDKNFYRNKKPETILATSTLEILKKSKNSLFSEDENEIIAWEPKKIELFWIGEKEKMPLWRNREKYTSFESQKEIKDLKNYPQKPDYFVVQMENGIFALEKEGPKNNIAPLYKGKSPKIFSIEENFLTLLDDGYYIRIELP